ncbi:MAG: SRPBCC family protein [Bacteroidia bacterium]
MLKKVLYVIIIIPIIYLILCFIGPKKIQVERSILINASPEIIKPKLTDFKFFKEEWSPLTEKDTAMKTTFTGETGMPGSKFTWEGNKEVGSGSMELIAINGDSVLQKVIFTAPRSGGGDVYLLTTPSGNATTVSWGMRFNVGFVSRGLMLFMNMDKIIGNDYDKGLAKFKEVIEAMPAEPTGVMYKGFEIQNVIWTERNYFGKKATVPFDKLNTFLEDNFAKIFNDAINNQLEHTGPPSGLFYTYDMQMHKTECAAVISVPNNQELKGWDKFNVPASEQALFVACNGGDKIHEAHAAIMDYMTENGLTHSLVIEEYLVGPMSEPDSTKWLTNIYYIINSNNGIQVKI